MLNYNACRISEFLDLKKENVHLKDQYFDVVAAKTENGVRKVPIADKLLPFYEAWFERSPCEYLLCTTEGQHLDYFNYCDTYWDPLMEEYDMKHTPHDTRHTCISMMADAGVAPTIQKKIAGHSGAMSLTERVYTHLNIQTLIDGINMICPV